MHALRLLWECGAVCAVFSQQGRRPGNGVPESLSSWPNDSLAARPPVIMSLPVYYGVCQGPLPPSPWFTCRHGVHSVM